MTIVRSKKSKNFLILDKACLISPRLSLKAKGLLSLILSFPDDWVIHPKQLLQYCRDGRDAVYSGLKELEEAGYLVYHQSRSQEGQFEAGEYLVYERPLDPHFQSDQKSEIDQETVSMDKKEAGPQETAHQQSSVEQSISSIAPHPEHPYPGFSDTATDNINNNILTKKTAASRKNYPEARAVSARANQAMDFGSSQNIERCGTTLAAAESPWKREDAWIGASLSPSQKTAIQEALAKVLDKNAVNPESLQKAVELSLLDPRSFTAAGQDFCKKLNTILKMLRLKRFALPKEGNPASPKRLPDSSEQAELRTEIRKLYSELTCLETFLASDSVSERHKQQFQTRLAQVHQELSHLKRRYPAPSICQESLPPNIFASSGAKFVLEGQGVGS